MKYETSCTRALATFLLTLKQRLPTCVQILLSLVLTVQSPENFKIAFSPLLGLKSYVW